MSEEKYKQFRNFMVNELGITRQDIEVWTKQSVVTEIGKVIDKLNIPALLNAQLSNVVKDVLIGNQYLNDFRELREMVATELAKQLEVKLK